MERRQLRAAPSARRAQRSSLKIVVADDLPESALELLRAEAAGQVDARSGRTPGRAGRRSRRRRRAARPQRDEGHRRSARRPRPACASSRAPAPASTTSMWPPPARAASWSSTRPGANSISVAEHACALMLALARIGAGRRPRDEGRQVGEEALSRHRAARQDARHRRARPHRPGGAQRARAFGMRIVAHDPFISREIAEGLGVELLSLDELCAVADYPDAAPAVDARDAAPVQRRAVRAVKPGIRIINTARGELIDEAALRARDRTAASSPAPGSTCSRRSRRPTGRWPNCRRSSRRRISPRRPRKRRNWSALDTAAAVRDFLRDGVVRNAVNFPSVHPDELQRLQPWVRLADIWRRSSRRWAPRGSRRSACATTARWPTAAPSDVLGGERRGRRAAADSVGRRVDRQRPRGRPRARHRDHRVAQHARAALHQPASRSSCTRATANAGPRARCSSRTARGWCRCAASTSRRRSPARC